MIKTVKEQQDNDAAIIDNKIRICIECGSIAVRIENHLLSCHKCGKEFRLRR